MADYRYAQDDNRTWGREDRDRYGSSGRYRSDNERSLFGGGWGGNQDNYARDRSRKTYDGDRNQYGRSRYGRTDDDRFGNWDSQRDVAINETSRLIASNKVEGTPVYGRRGERLGSIYNFMVDKRSGKVEYAVMTFGGFLGMGQHYYPIPWKMLDYDTDEDGYVVDLTERDLDRAPSYRRGQEPRYDRGYDRYVNGYYGTNY